MSGFGAVVFNSSIGELDAVITIHNLMAHDINFDFNYGADGMPTLGFPNRGTFVSYENITVNSTNSHLASAAERILNNSPTKDAEQKSMSDLFRNYFIKMVGTFLHQRPWSFRLFNGKVSLNYLTT